MREIKFRGKVPNTDIWIYGHLVEQLGAKSLKSPRRYIVSYDEKIEDYDWEMPRIVERESVGQFIGAYDCDDTEIYEGDICRIVGFESKRNVVIKWDKAEMRFAMFNLDGTKSPIQFHAAACHNLKVVGYTIDEDRD